MTASEEARYSTRAPRRGEGSAYGLDSIPRDPQPWIADALCREVGGDLWYPETGEPEMRTFARQICARCPVRAECLQYALDTQEAWGLWGGLTPRERRRLQRGGAA